MKKASLAVIPFIFAVCPAFAQNKVKVLETLPQVGSKMTEQVTLAGERTAQTVQAGEEAVRTALMSAARAMQATTIQAGEMHELQAFQTPAVSAEIISSDFSVSQIIAKQAFYNALTAGEFDVAQNLLDQTGKEVLLSKDVYFLCANLLHRAGHEKQITFLLENGLDPNKILLNIPLIHHAVLYEGQTYLPILKKYGADLNIQSGISKATPLHWAIYNYATTKELIKLGADPTIPNAQGRTPAQQAHREAEHADAQTQAELKKVENYYYHALYSFEPLAGSSAVVQHARVLSPSEVLSYVKADGRVLMPKDFSITDDYFYQGLQVEYVSDLKTIVKDGLVVTGDTFPQALNRALPAREDVKMIEDEPTKLRIPVVVRTLFSTQATIDNTHISPASIADVMVFWEFNGKPGWYRVTLQKNEELLFTPVPTAFASTYFFR
ncbi:ankyrin repeat domain-containing protein [Candidatus Avelusimicrobium luingense]|uniref:ankyrin repeat domain-containing protein n=1 Tax=Candidatus Avelusimicrobium luingense TaxID=3416211 RepID=UPI003D14E403